MNPSPQLKSLVDQMPDPDSKGMYAAQPEGEKVKKGRPKQAVPDRVSNIEIDKEKIEKAIAEIHQGGRENVVGIIDMLVPPGQGNDVKAHYALHCLANHVLKIKDEQARREFAETLAAQLGGDRPKPVQAYLCQELQWAGHKEAAPALGKLLLDEELVEPAAMALAAVGDGAAEQFRAALPKAQGKCRLNVIQGLGAIGDKQSAAALREALSDPDREVRLAAGWGLARMGDAGVDALLKAADVDPGWERIQATKHCLVLAEKLAASGQALAARQIYAHLRDTRSDPSERYIRDAAEKALAGGA